MDGVLIDSEPLWRRAEMECFARVGLELSEADCLQTTGLRIDEVAAHWFERSPWSGASPDAVAESIIDRMEHLIRAEGTAIEGAADALDVARASDHRVALASSSPLRLIDAVLDRFGWRDHFAAVCSAENEARGKPHPDVYLSAASAIGIEPVHCIAIEDSVHGVDSALAAGMRCIAVPQAVSRAEPGFARATWRIGSLTEFPALLADV